MKTPLKLLFALFVFLAGCSDHHPPAGPQYTQTGKPAAEFRVYRFAVHPLHNPQKLDQLFTPMMEYVNRRVPGVKLELEASNTYAHFEEKLKAGEPEFALPNPYHAVEARQWGYHVTAKMGNDADFRGIFLIRKDSGIRQPVDLKGRIVAYPAPTALAAAMMPQLYLTKHGINVNRDISNSYVGTHESSIMNVYLGQSAASATWPPPWRVFQRNHPKEASQLTIAWQTETLVQNAVIVRNDVPASVVNAVRTVLAHMHEDAEGRAILAGIETPSMDLATDADYEVVVRFLEEFHRLVRPN